MLKSLINLKKTTLEKEYFLIRSLIYQLDAKIKNENEQITKTIKELEKEVPIYVENINNLNNNIKNLRSELQLKNAEQILNFVNNEQDNINSDKTEESSTKLNEDDLTIKKLYRIISSKCHPDKTDDKSLHDLFILATEAYEHNNYTMIMEIYNKLINPHYDNNFSDISIEQKLDIIKKEYDKRKEEFAKLSGTNGYVINTLIKNNNSTKARKIFLNLLFDQTLELEKLKQQLETNLNKKI